MTEPALAQKKPPPVNGTRPQDKTAAGRAFSGTSFFGAGEPLLGEGLWRTPPKKEVSGGSGETKKTRTVEDFTAYDKLTDTSMMHIGP